jgi:hypothetical protein
MLPRLFLFPLFPFCVCVAVRRIFSVYWILPRYGPLFSLFTFFRVLDYSSVFPSVCIEYRLPSVCIEYLLACAVMAPYGINDVVVL